MLKWLAKKFMPSGETLAGYAADGIAKSVNESGADTKARVERVTAALDEKRDEYVQKRDAAALPTTKAIYQAFIDAIDRIKERLDIEGGGD